MKKLILGIVLVFSVVLINAQTATITIPDAWTDASTANLDQLTEWVVKGELTGIPGSKEYYISDTWDPDNPSLNNIRSNGGNTSNWPLYWNITDTTLFYAEVDDLLGDNIVSLKSANYTPNKTWGEWLNQSHVVYYIAAQGKYWILAADADGDFLDLETVISIKNNVSQINSYVTQPTVDGNGGKVQRNSAGLFE